MGFYLISSSHCPSGVNFHSVQPLMYRVHLTLCPKAVEEAASRLLQGTSFILDLLGTRHHQVHRPSWTLFGFFASTADFSLWRWFTALMSFRHDGPWKGSPCLHVPLIVPWTHLPPNFSCSLKKNWALVPAGMNKPDGSKLCWAPHHAKHEVPWLGGKDLHTAPSSSSWLALYVLFHIP